MKDTSQTGRKFCVHVGEADVEDPDERSAFGIGLERGGESVAVDVVVFTKSNVAVKMRSGEDLC